MKRVFFSHLRIENLRKKKKLRLKNAKKQRELGEKAQNEFER